MPRKTYLVSHYSADILKKKYLRSQDSIESRRWHLIWKVSQGWTLKDSAAAIGISYYYAIEILKKYNELGEEGLKNRKKMKNLKFQQKRFANK